MAFDFTTLLDPRLNEPGGPASETSDPAILAYLGTMYDAIQALGLENASSPNVSRLHALSTTLTGIASAAATPIPWTVVGGEAVGADVHIDGSVASQIDIVNAGIYIISVKGVAQAGSGKLIDDCKLQITAGTVGDTIELGSAHPSAADVWDGVVTFGYYLPAASTVVATLTAITHDASVWSIPTTCNAKLQRVG